MGEVIQFPAPNEVVTETYTVSDTTNEENICTVFTLKSARNIARILFEEHPHFAFAVFDDDGKVWFSISEGEETSE